AAATNTVRVIAHRVLETIDSSEATTTMTEFFSKRSRNKNIFQLPVLYDDLNLRGAPTAKKAL
ncbi:MAG: hypothetical protein AAGA97_12095, partial [Pseudomonadota bacterium]